jgi:hypothetical protein
MKKIKEFLVELDDDKQLREQFKKDPEGTARRAGLNPGQAKAVASGDLKRLSRAVEEESGPTTLAFVVMVA